MLIPTTVPALRELLDRHGLRPKKSLGQNFLISTPLLQSIVRAADLSHEDNVLEVGPGVGTLTWHIAQVARRVTAVELDQNMVDILGDTLSDLRNVNIIHADILRLDLAQVFAAWATDAGAEPVSFKVVANLPYYITSAVIRKFLDYPHRPTTLVLMVQQEVARRILAMPGDLSLLAVSVQFYAVPRQVLHLPAGAFYPAPNVDSAVIRLDVRAERPNVNVETFFRVAQAGFGQKRKQLRNSLAAGLGISHQQSEDLLRNASIDPQRRAQTLTIDEWVKLANRFVGFAI